MSRHYSGYRRRSYWGYRNISEREQLTAIAGGIDRDIERIFLNLPSYKLDPSLLDMAASTGVRHCPTPARPTQIGSPVPFG